MRHNDYSLVFSVYFYQQIHDLKTELRIDISGRLVRNDGGWIIGKRSGKCNAALLRKAETENSWLYPEAPQY